MLTTLRESVQNEANCRTHQPVPGVGKADGRTHRAKRSQSARSDRSATWTGEAAGGAVAGTAGTNEANLPAWTEMGAGGRRRPRRRRWGSLCQTNPICPAPAGKAPGCRGHKPCRPWAPACKTKPISRRRQERARAGKVVRAGTAGQKRAKQSQLRQSGVDGKCLVNKEL